MTPLTICISSLRERSASLCALLQSLALQDRANEVEVLVAIDGKQADGLQTTTGAKRNQLVAAARGLFVVHVDDDDSVSPLYIPTILAAITPEVDVVLIRGECFHSEKKVWEFVYEPQNPWSGYRMGCGLWADGSVGQVSHKPPDHLCPVRTEIARTVPFENRRVNEDVEWSRAVAPRLRSSTRANGVLYTYRTKAGREWERVE